MYIFALSKLRESADISAVRYTNLNAMVWNKKSAELKETRLLFNDLLVIPAYGIKRNPSSIQWFVGYSSFME